MSKEVTVEELREHLDEVLAEVENGAPVTITRDGKEIGTFAPKVVQKGVRFPFRNFDFGSRPKNLRSDVTALIREDRDSELKKHGL
jgi:antitoxin (DNA-binding transcriptional repressor) of toxin-antitoxin stability system